MLHKTESKKIDFDENFTLSYLIFPDRKIPFGDIILKYSKKNKLDPHLLSCIIFIESSFDREAVSSKGAVGLMQYLVQEENIWDRHKDPSFSIEVGSLHFKFLLDNFNGELSKAIAAYNCGINCVLNREELPLETLIFTERVLNCYREIWLRTPDVSFPFNFCKE